MKFSNQRKVIIENRTVPDEDGIDDLTTRRNKFRNLNRDFDDAYTSVKNQSILKDKKTLDHFDNLIKSNFEARPTILYEHHHNYRPLSSTAPMSRRHVVRTSNYNNGSVTLDDDVFPTSSLRAHPKLVIKEYAPIERIVVEETEDQLRKKNLEERLDRLIGYRNPRYRLSDATRNHVNQVGGNSIRRLYTTKVYEEEPEYLSKKKFVNYHKMLKS